MSLFAQSSSSNLSDADRKHGVIVLTYFTYSFSVRFSDYIQHLNLSITLNRFLSEMSSTSSSTTASANTNKAIFNDAEV
jgi:hypothetical protein